MSKFTDTEIELVARCIGATDGEFGLDDEDWSMVRSIFGKFGRGTIADVSKRSMQRMFSNRG